VTWRPELSSPHRSATNKKSTNAAPPKPDSPVLSLATSYSNFMEQKCNGEYKLIHVNREDRTFYRNMLLLIFTGQFLERDDQKVVILTLKATHNILVSIRMMWTGMGIISCF
jgi:hypothetical protein